MRLNIRRLLCASALTVLISSPVTTAAFADSVVRDIKIVGTERIEPATVMTYLDLQKGQVASQESLDAALKSLFATGLFADVQLTENNGTVTVTLIENPIINQVAFEGNDKLEDDQLQAEIQSRPRQVFTRTQVQNDVTRLYEVYRRNGRFSVQIEPKVIKLDQNRVNLVFEITEGDETTISTIRFVGNERFSDDELRSELSSQEHRWYNFLSSSDRYDPDRLQYDLEMLRQFYLKEGYADFRVLSSSSELSKDKKDFFITVTVDEGERYKVSDISVKSMIRDLDPNGLIDQVTFKPQDWYNAEDVKTTIDAMTKRLGDLQYAFVTVVPDVQRDKDAKTVNIVFNINESPRVFVERIDIDGNVRTLDKVVRRKMELVEGDPFNRTKLAASEKNIRDLDYFENVEVKTLPGSAPDKTVVDVQVEEKSTGEVSVGAGFSTADGPLADFRLRERNFLGKGQDATLAATIAGSRTEFDLSFTEPYFLDRDLAAGVDLFHITRDQQDESSFDQRRTGGGVRLGYPLSEHWRQTLRYRIEQNEITNVDADASRFIRDQEGQRATSALSQRLTYEDLDSKVFPTDGMNAWFETEVAGLGGDAEYVSGKLGGTYYYPIAKSWTFSLLGEVGAIGGYGDSDVKINERFFLGGTTLRGFAKSGVGPRDLATDDSLGGNTFYRASAEVMFPIGFPEEMGVAGHMFTDIGSLWGVDTSDSTGIADESSLRASAGVGFSWRSPMGPVRIDLAAPYLKEEYDDKELFRFSFGTRF